MCIGIEEPEINGLEGESPSFFGITLSQQFLSFFIGWPATLTVRVAIRIDSISTPVKMLAYESIILIGKVKIAFRTPFDSIPDYYRRLHDWMNG